MLIIIKAFLERCLTILFGIFNINNNKILFIANDATAYTCNPKSIAEYLNENRNYDIVWVFNKNLFEKVALPYGMRKVKYRTLKFFYEWATASVIVSNHRLSLSKRNGQKYIQTWHSSMRLKKIEGDAVESLDESYIEMAKKDSRNIDLVISGCDFSTEFFKRAFWYDGEIAKTGTPRIDFLFDKENVSKSQKKIGNELDVHSKFLLYAPTFRKNKGIEFYDIDADKIIAAMQEKDGIRRKLLTKLHPNLINMIDSLRKQESLVNASHYSDTQELILASEMVITDYSSLMFDCAFIHKPCILYMPDFEEYISKERGLYFSINELPFPKAYTTCELIKQISEFDIDKYKKDIDDFLLKIGSYENGHSCESVAKIIDEMTRGKR